MKRSLINTVLGAIIAIPLLILASCSDDKDTETPFQNAGLKITSTETGVVISEDGTTAAITIPPVGGRFNLSISADKAWSLSDRDDEWCVITGSDDKITISALEFASDYNRQTMIRIMVGEVVAGYINVSQNGTGMASLEIDKTEILFPETGATEEVKVTSNKEWTVSGYEDLGWLEVTKGDDYFNVTAVRNDVPVEFTATLTVTAGTDLNNETAEITVSLEPWSPVYLDVDRDTVVIPEDGGEVTIQVSTNREWSASSTGSWVNLEKNGNELTITAPPSTSGNLEAEINFETTSGKDYADRSMVIKQYTDPFILEFTLTGPNLEIAAPLVGQVNCYIDWGDDTSSSFAGYSSQYGEAALPHVYQEPGVYHVKMYGSAEKLCTYLVLDNSQLKTITSIISWGSLGFTDVMWGFSGTSIKSIPDGYREFLENVTVVHGIFQDCIQLERVPADLFHNSSATHFAAVFNGCTSLKEIPADLFKGSDPNGFGTTFMNCTSLKEIPAGLFDGMRNVQSLSSTFSGCTGITSVPEGLLDDCTEITTIYSLFEGCTSLQTVPADLFDNCRNIFEFSTAFNGCTSLRGSSPFTIIEGNPVHFWERENYPSEFSFEYELRVSGCFRGCTDLDDYADIPDDWK